MERTSPSREATWSTGVEIMVRRGRSTGTESASDISPLTIQSEGSGGQEQVLAFGRLDGEAEKADYFPLVGVEDLVN